MKKSDLVQLLVNEKDMKKKDAIEAVNLIFSNISEALSQGDKVKLHGFGNFEVRERAPRLGRNPQTGDRLQIPKSKSPAFKASGSLKRVVSS